MSAVPARAKAGPAARAVNRRSFRKPLRVGKSRRRLKDGIASAYRRVAAPFARRRLKRLANNGLPPPLAFALAGLFDTRVPPDEARVAQWVERRRLALAESTIEAEVYAGASGFRRVGAPALAHRSSVDATWGRLLYRCAQSIGAHRILEIGASAGLSGCYLAAATTCERFVTIEVSGPLAALARKHLAEAGGHAVVVQGLVEAVLDDALALLEGPIDLVYQDALKDAEGIADCVERLSPALRDGALLIFDDIRWSPSCQAGWNAVRRRAEVTSSVDAGRFGLCVWRGDPAALAYADLSRYLGWLRVHRGFSDTMPHS